MIAGFLLKVHDPSSGRISEYELRAPWPAKVTVAPGNLVLGMPTGPASTHHIEIESFIQNRETTAKHCSSCGSYELGPAERFRILVAPKNFWENGGGFLTVTASDHRGSSAQILLEVAIGEPT